MKILLSCIGMLLPLLVSAQAQPSYYPSLPDTVFPCRNYSNYQYAAVPKRAANSAFTNPDTFELRLNTTVIRLVASNSGLLMGYELEVPCGAKAGDYSIYNSKGQTQPQRKVVVANPNAYSIATTSMIKRSDINLYNIEEEPKVYGLSDIIVGVRYSLLFESKTLLFGPLPTSGNFITEAASISFVGGTDTIPMEIESIPNPFQAYCVANIPFGLAPKSLNLIVKWKDGTSKICGNLARIVTRKAPVVKRITPETLSLGAITQLSISGDDLGYVIGGTNSSLDRSVILGTYLKNGNQILSGLPFLPSSPTSPGSRETGGFYAQFDVPLSFPTGPADLLIHVSGRNDTTLFPKVLQIAERPLLITEVTPKLWSQSPMQLKAKLNFIPPKGPTTKAVLRKGSAQITSSVFSFSDIELTATATFPFGMEQDTGFYDLELVSSPDFAMTLKNAVHIFPPQLTGEALRIQRGEKVSPINISLRFPLAQSNDTSAQVIGSLCRKDQCIPFASTERVDFVSNLKASADLPVSTEIGLYDLKLDFKGRARPLVFSQSVIVYGKEHQVWVPERTWHDSVPKVYFTTEVGKSYRWSYKTICDQTQFTPIHFPTGATLMPTYAEWTPSLTDTGMHTIEVKAPDSCGGKTHLQFVQVVEPSTSVALFHGSPTPHANRSAKTSPQFMRQSNGITLVWSHSNPGFLQLFSLNGRLMASRSFAQGGLHRWTLGNTVSTGEMVFMRWSEARAREPIQRAPGQQAPQVFRLRMP